MDIKRLERMADRVLDVFSDMRVSDHELIYVAMYTVIKSYNRDVVARVIEYGKQVEWEVNNQRRNDSYVQDRLF
jgi:hypothetical protein